MAKRDHSEDWKPLLERLEAKKSWAREMGGPDRVDRFMHSRGKLDANTAPYGGALFLYHSSAAV